MSDEQLQERDEVIKIRRDAFRAVLLHPAESELLPSAAIVLEFLAHKCFASRPTIYPAPAGMVDPLIFAHNEGMRSVWNTIAQALDIDDTKLRQMIKRARAGSTDGWQTA